VVKAAGISAHVVWSFVLPRKCLPSLPMRVKSYSLTLSTVILPSDKQRMFFLKNTSK